MEFAVEDEDTVSRLVLEKINQQQIVVLDCLDKPGVYNYNEETAFILLKRVTNDQIVGTPSGTSKGVKRINKNVRSFQHAFDILTSQIVEIEFVS